MVPYQDNRDKQEQKTEREQEPERGRCEQTRALAAARGVRVHPLSQYCHKIPPLPSTLVLGYAGLTEDELPRAAERLIAAYT